MCAHMQGIQRDKNSSQKPVNHSTKAAVIFISKLFKLEKRDVFIALQD